MTDLSKPDYARNMRIVSHTDQGGRPGGVQVMVHRGFAYVGHIFSTGFSVIDVRDAKNPRTVDAKGLIYATDYNAGLYILEFSGA
jgi:hypothetical protein